MADLTYTAQGTFDQNGTANLKICIPKEVVKGSYVTALYNLSKISVSGSTNVILCHFSDGNSTGLQHNSFDNPLIFRLDTLTNHSGVVDFDETKDDALFIFFHDKIFQRSDRDYFFQNIELILELVRQHGNHNGTIPLNYSASADNPRKVGMSLITRRLS